MPISEGVVLALTLIAVCVSLVAAWWRFELAGSAGLLRARRFLFRCGLIGSTASLLLVLAFTMHALLIKHDLARPVDLDRLYPVLTFLVISFVAAVCGAFGRGTARFLLMASGLVLTILWYLLGLAVSL